MAGTGPFYQIVATLPGNGRKSLTNKSESQVLEYVVSFLVNGTIKEGWGEKEKSYQVYELRVHQTKKPYDKKAGEKLDEVLKGNANRYSQFEKKARQLIDNTGHRAFIVMPIQGKEFGDQNEQRIYKEFELRFLELKKSLEKFDVLAIRIDREFPLDQLVVRIKSEILKASFIIADLTEERPSCYFEAGYAEALAKPVIYMASEMGIIDTAKKTKIHFDVHMNVNFFSNHQEMCKKIENVVEKNREILLRDDSKKIVLTS